MPLFKDDSYKLLCSSLKIPLFEDDDCSLAGVLLKKASFEEKSLLQAWVISSFEGIPYTKQPFPCTEEGREIKVRHE